MANRRTAPTLRTTDSQKDIGGAIVRRRFSYGGEELQAGHVMSAGEVLAIPRNNYNSLRDNGFLEPFPRQVRTHMETENPEPKEYHASNRGFGVWDVIEGRKINSKPLTKAQADDLVKQKGLTNTATLPPDPIGASSSTEQPTTSSQS